MEKGAAERVECGQHFFDQRERIEGVVLVDVDDPPRRRSASSTLRIRRNRDEPASFGPSPIGKMFLFEISKYRVSVRLRMASLWCEATKRADIYPTLSSIPTINHSSFLYAFPACMLPREQE